MEVQTAALGNHMCSEILRNPHIHFHLQQL